MPYSFCPMPYLFLSLKNAGMLDQTNSLFSPVSSPSLNHTAVILWVTYAHCSLHLLQSCQSLFRSFMLTMLGSPAETQILFFFNLSKCGILFECKLQSTAMYKFLVLIKWNTHRQESWFLSTFSPLNISDEGHYWKVHIHISCTFRHGYWTRFLNKITIRNIPPLHEGLIFL